MEHHRPITSRRLLLGALVTLGACGASPSSPSGWGVQESLVLQGGGLGWSVAGFSPDGRRALGIVRDVMMVGPTSTLTELVRGPGDRLKATGSLVIEDVAFGSISSVALSSSGTAILGAPCADGPSCWGAALVYAGSGFAWELQSTAGGHAQFRSISDDGELIASQAGVARWSGKFWVDESPLSGVLSGDGTRLVTVTQSKELNADYSKWLVIRSFRPEQGAWVEETWYPVFLGDPWVTPHAPPRLSRDGSTLAVPYAVWNDIGSEKSTGVLLLSREGKTWKRVHLFEGARYELGEVRLSASGDVLAVNVDDRQVKLYSRDSGWQSIGTVPGSLVALAPGADAVATQSKEGASTLLRFYGP